MSSIETIRSFLETHVKEIGAVVLATAALLFVRKLRQAPR